MKKCLIAMMLSALLTAYGVADDAKAIQGTWYCIALVPGGVSPPTPEELKEIKAMTLTFKDDSVTIEGAANGGRKGKFVLETNVSPKRLSIKEDELTQLRSVYVLDNDLLVLTFSEGSDKFPEGFSVTADLRGGMLVFQKTKPTVEKQADKPVQRPVSQMQAMNKMKQIAMAVHNYEAFNKKLPRDICDKQGKPLLSWRVAILPYLEQVNLYKQFKLDEPWDSEHNKPLSAMLPSVYRFDESDDKSGTTPFQAFTGNGAIMEKGKDIHFRDIQDGLSNTLLFVETKKGVIWSKPEDIEFDASKPGPALGGHIDNVFHVAMCDGYVRALPLTIKDSTLKAMITRAGGEVVEALDDMKPAPSKRAPEPPISRPSKK